MCIYIYVYPKFYRYISLISLFLKWCLVWDRWHLGIGRATSRVRDMNRYWTSKKNERLFTYCILLGGSSHGSQVGPTTLVVSMGFLWGQVWNIFYFPIYWVSNHPNSLIFFQRGSNHQPEYHDTCQMVHLAAIIFKWQLPERNTSETRSLGLS